MGLQSRVDRVERKTGFAPLPCPVCESAERFVREWVALVGDRPFWGEGVFYSYKSLCRFCGRAETRRGNAPDEETARRFAGILDALAEGRFCEVENLDLAEFSEAHDRAARECLGADFPKWRALCEDMTREFREAFAAYKPRVPYVCCAEVCTCPPEWKEGRKAGRRAA